MRVRVSGPKELFVIALCAGMLLPPLACRADESSAPVKAGWQVQEIRHTYTSRNVGYECRALAARLKNMLVTLGAHEQTRVVTQGCQGIRPEFNVLITITTATPTPLTHVPNANTENAALLSRMGLSSDQLEQSFSATWKRVELVRDPELNFEASDCELLRDVREKVLARISAKIETGPISCNRTGSRITPQLTVSVLVPVRDTTSP